MTRWNSVIVALLAGVVAAGHVGKLPPALPAIRADLGLDLLTAGWLASMFSVTGMLLAIFLGAVADRLNHWRLAVGGMVVMAAGGAAGSLTASAAQLIASRFVEGIGFLAVAVAAPSIIARSVGGRQQRMALGFWPGYMPAGVTIMILAAPLALNSSGWRGLWGAVAVLAVAGAISMLLFGGRAPTPTAHARGAAVWANIRATVSEQGPWLLAGCFALYGAQLYAIITWMPTFMIEERGADVGTAAGLTALVVALNGLCNVLGGWLLHRGATPWAMIAAAGAAMAISAFGTFSAAVPDAARYAFSLILCGAGGVVASATFALAPLFARSPAQTGVVNGVLVQASSLAQFAGPAALAAIVSRSGRWESALWVIVGVNALMILLSLLLYRQEKMLPA
jgi:cyanate permease